jgi:hypothetical protein
VVDVEDEGGKGLVSQALGFLPVICNCLSSEQVGIIMVVILALGFLFWALLAR